MNHSDCIYMNYYLPMYPPMDISAKLTLLHKVTSVILPQAKHQLQQSKEEKTYQDPPSPLITEPPTLTEFPMSPPSPLITEPPTLDLTMSLPIDDNY